jgi:outer membrane protein assembly factor BamA
MKTLSFFFLILLLPLRVWAQTAGEERFLFVPLVGYSDEQGVGIGADAAWLNVSGSSWTVNSSLFSSSLYNQTFLNLSVTNNKLFELGWFQAGGFIYNSTRSLFYGLGNGSGLANATQYAINDNDVYLRGGIRIYDELIFGVGYAHRSTGIDRGSDPLLPQFLDVYANSPRISGTTTTSTSVFFAYDTRTPTFAPQEGNFGYMSLSQAQPRSGEDLAQKDFLITGVNYYDIIDKDLILVSRGKFEHEWGENVPFFLQTALGGVDSLRGFRTNRFIDAVSTLINEEGRFTFWNGGSGLIQRLELSLAFELGEVSTYSEFPPFGGYHTDWDLGLTGLLEGGIPIRLDYAFSPESGLIYLHLFYPF